MATGWRLREEREERREERGESDKVWRLAEEGRTETENAGECCDQDNRHSEWYRD